MHPNKTRAARTATAIVASLCLLAAPAIGDDRPWEQARWHALNVRSLSNAGDLSSGQRCLESQLHTDDQHGFEYSRNLSLNYGRNVVFSVQGPLVAEWAPGLTFELRF